ncbi:MAG: helix-turn-helix transcriptional regulator [Propionibacteriaceae bacterium]|jgi:transcriptional regulator with XRE-family HTH domain|nr:helix-turn-helix transcriptional regulator [Propionibacteriaceae bacterium]
MSADGETPADDWDAERTAIMAQLRAEIAAAGLSVAELCRRAGVPRPTIDRYLAGERDMPLSTLHRIARAVRVEPATILARAKDRRGARP